MKLPKAITHVCKLIDAEARLDTFLAEAGGLGAKLGCLLVQLAPKHALDETVAARFFAALRECHAGDIALEPRHASWFTESAAQLCERYRVARVAADPARVPEAARPGGSPHVAYWRWHGSPRMYWSSYDDAALRDLAGDILAADARGQRVWCIFDNTTAGAAAANALTLRDLLASAA